MKTKPSKAEHKRDRLPQIRRGEGEPIRIVLPPGALANKIELVFPEPVYVWTRLDTPVPQEEMTHEQDPKTSDTD